MVFIDGTEITDATIDGTQVTEITIDGIVAWGASGLEIVATLNGGIAELTLYEDATGNGTPDTSQTYALLDGTNDYDIELFDLSTGNVVWYDLTVDNASVTDTVEISSISLKH